MELFALIILFATVIILKQLLMIFNVI